MPMSLRQRLKAIKLLHQLEKQDKSVQPTVGDILAKKKTLEAKTKVQLDKPDGL